MIINSSFSSSLSNKERFGSLKSLVLLVVIAILATSNSYAQASFETIDGLRYLIDSDAKTATLTANVGEKYSGDIVVPEKVKASDGVEYPVTAFGDNAFKECGGLKSVTIPSSVTSLGESCFRGCSGLTSITIPSSVTSLGDNCFCCCIKFKSVEVPSSVLSMGSGCFENCENLVSAKIEAQIGRLNMTFADCYKLEKIELPQTITSLDNGCFNRCYGLTSFIVPNTVESLGSSVFAACTNLSYIEIPNSVKRIGMTCFGECKSLTSITLPLYLEDLSYYCFTQCENLKEVKCLAMVPPTGSQLSLPTGCKIYVPKSVLDSYKTSSTWQDFPIFALDNSGTGVAQCEIPTINYDNGTIKVFSATPNSVCHYSISCDDVTTNNITYDGNIYLSAAYNISAYATADGYEPSDNATATLYWVEANLQNTTTNINQTATRGIIVTSNDGIVTLSGLNNDETVRFYTVDGKQLGAAKAVNGAASQAVSESVVIAKMGNQTIKIAVK
ncbi:MAG: leucine-rich repeat domain-containing protein [Prevotella sp.]|uniref:leucine-rich repeat domain-containing protein n=1 Tax=Prevotella sp. TaxID=59823 RepID=UPI0025D05212|nr:leucine-rich repeat domain-containing protein [Prevotella sp.]MCI7184163.1 leucine-rich repeat domain-containing protein [Prevotella sp.]